MYSFKKLIKSNEGFTLIELITVIGVFSILGIIALPRFLEVIQRAEKVIAANSISSIKIECESNNSLGRNLIFTPSNLIGYEFDNEGSNKCTGNENFSLVSIIPEDLNRVIQSVEKSYTKNANFYNEFRVNVNGVEKWISGRSKIQKHSDGSASWRGVMLDITEKKKLENLISLSMSFVCLFFRNLGLITQTTY